MARNSGSIFSAMSAVVIIVGTRLLGIARVGRDVLFGSG